MEREPLSPESDALWRRLWEIWQDNDEEDVILDSGSSDGTAAVVRRSVPELGPIASAPWWMWTGGLLGAFVVCASVVLTPRLGAATTIGVFLTGQVVASIVIDHFGLLGVQVQSASFARIGGALLIVVGVVIVQRF